MTDGGTQIILPTKDDISQGEGLGGIAGRLIAVALLLATAGCHPRVNAPSAEPILDPLVVNTPTAIGCVPPDLDASPDYPDTDAALKAAAGPDGRYQLLYAGRKLRVARLNELEPIVGKCPKAPSK